VTFSDSQITKEGNDWLYYQQMMQAIKKVAANSIFFSFLLLSCQTYWIIDNDKFGWIAKLVSIEYLITIKYSEPEKTTGPSGVEPAM